jgi:serine/threonine-protein kinase PpkA
MPVLFFRDHESLVRTCADENLGGLVRTYMQQAEKQRAGQDTPVIAMEPSDSEGAVSRNRFYLMPVLNMDDQFQVTRLVEVASIDPGSGAGQAARTPSPDELTTGVAFVIDTTISMRPYIEQTLSVVRAIYDKLEKSPDGDKVSFAVVAFRNSLTASPGLEYVTRVISDFKNVRDRQSLESALAAVREAAASSHAFDEDSLGGVKTAVDKLSWGSFGSRVMLLVSDAGPLGGSDEYSSTGMDAAEMGDYLRANNIWLTALHVRTPQGRTNHARAEKAYRDLSRMTDGAASYIPLNAATPQSGAADFARTGRALADSYSQMAEATAAGRMLAKPLPSAPADDPEERARQLAAITGYAMQLEFFGASRNTRAPDVVRAWIADADLERLAEDTASPVIAVTPAVLLTKNQLSDLTAQLKLIIDQATRSQRLGGTDFFQSLISMAAQLARDPSRFSHTPGQNLAQTGVLGEFLDGLPYKSDVLGMTENDWYNKSVGEQAQFINRLRSRIARYEEYDKDRTNWESFGSPNPGDWVYRVPLSMLP